MTKSFAMFHRGERVTLEDFQRVAETSTRAIVDQLVAKLLVGDDAESSYYVVHGFDATASGTELTITRGVAVAGYKSQNQTHYGSILSGGDESITRDLADLDDGSHKVFVRLNFTPGGFKNRPHWNPLTPGETVRNVPTQNNERWSFVVEQVAPGPEWMQIWALVKSGGTLSLVDTRVFYFEGPSFLSWVVPATEWGTVDDRNDDRATYGLFGLRRTLRALMKDIGEIKGSTRWWQSLATIGAQSLYDLTEGKLARDGSQTMTGNLNPETADAQSIGNTTRWNLINVRNITSELINVATGLYASTFSEGTGAKTKFFRSLPVSTLGGAVRLFRGMTGAAGDTRVFELLYNADWVDGSPGNWSRAAAATAVKIEIGGSTIRLLKHASGDAATWADTIAAGTWTQLAYVDFSTGTATVDWAGLATVTGDLAVIDGRIVTPNVYVGDSVTGATVPEKNTVYGTNIVKALAIVTTTAAGGGLDVGNTMVHGVGVSVDPTGHLNFTLHNDMVLPYGVIAMPMYDAPSVFSFFKTQPSVVDENSFTVNRFSNGGAAVDHNTSDTKTLVIVMGEHAP